MEARDIISKEHPVRCRDDEWVVKNICEGVLDGVEYGKELSTAAIHSINVSLSEFAEN